MSAVTTLASDPMPLTYTSPSNSSMYRGSDADDVASGSRESASSPSSSAEARMRASAVSR
jgi:hypothetical protein